jgi:hypothetical protein
MEMKPVQSKAATHIGYDPKTRELRIRFKRGREFSYSNVDPTIHSAIVTAPSIGRAISHHLPRSGKPVT